MVSKAGREVLSIVAVQEMAGSRPQRSMSSAEWKTCVHARRLLDAGRAQEALQLLEHASQTGANSAEFQFALGRAAFRVGDHAAASRAFRRAVALSPQNEVYSWLACLVLRGDDVTDDAADSREQSLSDVGQGSAT